MRRPSEDGAEIEFRWLKPKKAWNHQTVKTAKQAPPCRSLEEAQPCQHLNFRLLASKAVREYISTIWSLPVSYNLLQSHRKLRYNTTKQTIYILLLFFSIAFSKIQMIQTISHNSNIYMCVFILRMKPVCLPFIFADKFITVTAGKH